MATVTITTNLAEVIGRIATNFELLQDKEYLLRPLAIETIPNMKERIHKNGQASDNSAIGSYSNGYMKEREKNNRGEDRKIIVSLTRQLENDWAVLATSTGYGIGFNNPFNKDKARWVEEQKSKIIFNLSVFEKEYITERLKELVNGAINP
jgi:hypothetical protein